MTQTPVTAHAEQATVFIVDDDPSICEGICNLLEAVGIRAEHYSSAESFRDRWNSSLTGCLLLDARLPGMSGVEFQAGLHTSGISIPIVFMTAHGDMPMVRKVMKAGAVEFLIKPFQKEELLNAVEQAFELDRSRRAEEAVQNSILTRIDSLSDREREVMTMVTAGMLNKQIAAELNLSEITVKFHRRRVMDRMQAGSLAELVRMCERVKAPSWNGSQPL
jgi:FixJ family two-component response regulator